MFPAIDDEAHRTKSSSSFQPQSPAPIRQTNAHHLSSSSFDNLKTFLRDFRDFSAQDGELKRCALERFGPHALPTIVLVPSFGSFSALALKFFYLVVSSLLPQMSSQCFFSVRLLFILETARMYTNRADVRFRPCTPPQNSRKFFLYLLNVGVITSRLASVAIHRSFRLRFFSSFQLTQLGIRRGTNGVSDDLCMVSLRV